jgi:hypothetical protein
MESATSVASVSGFFISLISSEIFFLDSFESEFRNFSISAPFLPIKIPGFDV